MRQQFAMRAALLAAVSASPGERKTLRWMLGLPTLIILSLEELARLDRYQLDKSVCCCNCNSPLDHKKTSCLHGSIDTM